MEHFLFQSFDEWAAANQHADIRVTLSSRQQTHWELGYISLGKMSVQWGQDAGPNLVEGSSPAGGLTLLVPQHNAESIIGNGRRMADGSVFVAEPGTEFCLASTSFNRWSSLFIPYDQLTSIGARTEEIHRRHGVLPPTAAGQGFRRFIQNVGAVSHDVSDTRWSTATIEATTTRIAQGVCQALGLPRETIRTAGRPIQSRSEITRSAQQILEKRYEEQISVSGLADMVGVSERTLRTVFLEYFGVSPTKYLKNRTLHHARKLLKQSDPFASTVTEIAIGLGIWELGRFSHDYKMLFGESPSATLRGRKI
jgi:AraC family ethanolamine operon transcriptional activator